MKLPEWWGSDKPYKIMDCLEGMRSIPDKSVDLVITDPPYGINKEGIINDDIPIIEYIDWMKKVVNEVERITADGYFIFHNETMLFKLAHIYQDCRLFASCNNFAIMGRGMPYAWSPVVFKMKNKRAWCGQGRNWFISNTANMVNTPKKIGHPTPKPIDVLIYILGQFDSNIILDPFLGSGTTLRACRETGRIGLGFELNPQYEQVIKDRIMEKIPNIETFGEQIS